jgi:hypothetical protein
VVIEYLTKIVAKCMDIIYNIYANCKYLERELA